MPEPDELGRLIAELRGERAILPLSRRAGISDSRWGQIERGSATSAETLWRMAVAMDARPDEIKALFEAAGFQDLYEGLTRIGRLGKAEIPPMAEAGILADPTLTAEDKSALMEDVEARRALAEKRAAAGKPHLRGV